MALSGIRLGIDGRELAGGAPTGIGRYLVEVLRAVSRTDWECLVYGVHDPALSKTFPSIEFRDERIGSSTITTQWWDQVALPRRLARDGVTVFLSPYYKGPLFASCPTVITVHDLLFIRYPGSWRPLYDLAMTALARLYTRRATAVVTDSDFSKRSITQLLGLTPNKVHVIPIAPNPIFQPTPLTQTVLRRYRLSHPYILYVGNSKPHKNLPRLLEAYARLHFSLHQNYQLVLAGFHGPAVRSLQRLALRLHIPKLVRFPGVVDDADLPALYSGATVFVLPSLVEGFGLPVLEAMRCGTAVAASNRAAIPEVAGDAAILFDPDDASSITQAMAQVLTQVRLRERLRQRGQERSREFSSERTTARLLEVLRETSLAQAGQPSKVPTVPSVDGQDPG